MQARIIGEVEIDASTCARLAPRVDDEHRRQRIRVRLVHTGWTETVSGGTKATIPVITAEFSERKDATGNWVWEPADSHAEGGSETVAPSIILAALGDLLRPLRLAEDT